LQQPFGHETALHPQVPLIVLQYWPGPHAVQVTPPVPHELFDSAP
jgi:hypothetical protein